MNLIENSFLHPATPFVILAIMLPFLRGNWWRPLLLVPPFVALFLALLMKAGSYWEVDYVGQALVLGRVDHLSLPFVRLFALMSICATLYAYHEREKARHVAALFFMAGAFGCTLAGDYWTLYIFWQGMTVSSAFLIWLKRTSDSARAGVLYMFMLLFSSVLLLAGILLRQRALGTFIFGPANTNLMWHYDWLILMAFAINSAVVPLHAWLPYALPRATLTGTVFLSIFGFKSAIYAMARCFHGLDLLIIMGVITAVYGGVRALFSNDVRRILAYLMLAQGGLMVTALGMDSETALNGAIALAFFHTFYNGLLFMAMTTVIYTTSESQLTHLGKLAAKLPVAAGATVLGALCLCAVPFFGGFPGISLIFEAVLEQLGPVMVALLLIAFLSTVLAGGLRLPWLVFGSKTAVNRKPLAPVPKNMTGALILTGLLCLALGFLPALVYPRLPFPIQTEICTIFKTAMTLLFLAGTVFLFIFLRPLLQPKEKELPDFERLYRFLGQMIYVVFSKPLSWLDSIWSELYRTVFIRFFRFLARMADRLDRKGLDRTVDQTAATVMGISKISVHLQSGRLQTQLARMMLLALGIFALIWFW